MWQRESGLQSVTDVGGKKVKPEDSTWELSWGVTEWVLLFRWERTVSNALGEVREGERGNRPRLHRNLDRAFVRVSRLYHQAVTDIRWRGPQSPWQRSCCPMTRWRNPSWTVSTRTKLSDTRSGITITTVSTDRSHRTAGTTSRRSQRLASLQELSGDQNWIWTISRQ